VAMKRRKPTPRGDAIFTMRAPAVFYESLAKCILIRPDGEVVTLKALFDEVNRFVSIEATAKARTVGWRSRMAHWLLETGA
jgi:hypothetical protein